MSYQVFRNEISSLTEREHRSFLQTYKRLPVEIDRAEGMYVYDTEGNRYLDFLGGIAVNALGHSHPKVIEAIERQIRRYMHVSNFFYQDTQIAFVELLKELSGYDRAFLSNSGTEATDGAMKLARKWGAAHSKKELIAFTGGFHGRGYAALSLMDKPKYKQDMGPFLSDITMLPFNDTEALRNAVNGTTAAIFIEFLQGEGGITEASPEFVAELDRLRKKHGFLIVADEVQTGGGRTGTFNVWERYGVKPDIVTLAKGIGGGLPLGAILTMEELADVWGPGQHGTTFGGNAVSCAAGTVVLEQLKSGLMKRVAQTGVAFKSRLEELVQEFPEVITEIRGYGAILGLQLMEPAAPYVEELLDRNIIANVTNETVLRLLPPLIYNETHYEEFLTGLREILTERKG